MAGVDALIVDCSYTQAEEYPAKQGWGHGTFDSALAMALRVGAKALYCTHHEPTRSDEELEAVFAEVHGAPRALPAACKCCWPTKAWKWTWPRTTHRKRIADE